ncbi:S66 peptidase family protein [Bordetella genomosp. 12]|uniref:LD-carboxypeptidase n=1 Tax=Bordetella genomosp. 12 TaxID=463035 RepID=A0A261VPS5_9BORD|nr:LD-carboxypeptidase [Bordetella genomosp. 12]OZI75223.1 LD-carboxypeptidase [Bordetella genomosp. 12]
MNTPPSPGARPVPALKPGAVVAVIAPASAADGAAQAAAAWLEGRGYQPRLMVGTRMDTPYDYLAGPDSLRLASLHTAFASADVGAVWCLQGGFGSWRLLDQVDYALIRANPKPFIGYSDITALHLALQRRVGFVTFHGPMLGQDFIPGRSEPTESLAWAMLSGQLGEGSWIEAPAGSQVAAMAPGQASGRLVGGNLALISALMGTDDEIDTRGAILFIEDVNELPPRVDRMLAQLAGAAKLEGVAGVLVGNFTRGAPGSDPAGQSLYWPILRDALLGLDVPVLTGWPSGHWNPNLMLPLGARVTLDTQRRALRLDQAVVRQGTA